MESTLATKPIDPALDLWNSLESLDFDLDGFDPSQTVSGIAILGPDDDCHWNEEEGETVRPWQLDKKYTRLQEKHEYSSSSPSSITTSEQDSPISDTPTPSATTSEQDFSISDSSPPSGTKSEQESPVSDTGDAITFVWSVKDKPQQQPTTGKDGRIRKAPASDPARTNGRPKRKSRAGPEPRNGHHNQIEKRYRNRLSDHFKNLQTAVPTLRHPDTPAAAADYTLLRNPLTRGLKSTHKRNKATICAKAVEYIRHLEDMVKTSE